MDLIWVILIYGALVLYGRHLSRHYAGRAAYYAAKLDEANANPPASMSHSYDARVELYVHRHFAAQSTARTLGTVATILTIVGVLHALCTFSTFGAAS